MWLLKPDDCLRHLHLRIFDFFKGTQKNVASYKGRLLRIGCFTVNQLLFFLITVNSFYTYVVPKDSKAAIMFYQCSAKFYQCSGIFISALIYNMPAIYSAALISLVRALLKKNTAPLIKFSAALFYQRSGIFIGVLIYKSLAINIALY